MASPNPSKPAFELEDEHGAAAGPGSFVRLFLRLMAYLGRHRGIFAGGVTLILLATAAALFEPRLLGYAIDQAVIPGDVPRLKWLALAFLGVEIIRVAATIAQSLAFTALGQRVMQDLRLELLSHLQRLPVSTFDRNPAGRLVTRVTNDIGSLAEMFSSGFMSILSNLLTVAGTVAWLFWLDWRIALAATAILPPLAWVSVAFSRRLRVAYREARARLSAFNSSLAENLMGMRVVQLFGREARQLERLGAINESYARAQIGSVRVFAFFQPSITWATGIAMAAVIAYGGRRALLPAAEGGIAPGVLVAFFAYVMAVFQPIREIADKWNLFLSGMASAERIFSLLEWPVEVPLLGPIHSRRGELRGEITFEGVWFAYDAENWVLRDFSLHVRPGMRVGVVGHTGAGKTTLISLLLRFYEPSRGRILVDGRDIREWDRRELRSRIGMIQQDVFLFSGSIEQNVSLFHPGREVDAGEIGLSSLPELYERGVNLSMGERQKVAFHRARVADPDLWILDEATSNVDSRTETELASELSRAAGGATQLLVAHRLATVRDCDLILVLHQGRLVESGRHEELMSLGGTYSRLVALQAMSES